MHQNEPLDQRQSNAQSAFRAIQSPIGLSEEIENMWQKFWGDADSRIANPNHRLLAFLLNGEPDVAAFVRILGGIVQQID